MTNEPPPLILITDDNPNNIKVAGSTISTMNYKIAVAQNGEDTIEFAKKKLPELIILDIMMSGMDGLETCRRLKSDPTTADIPVIFLTAKNDNDTIKAGFDAGAVDYITKPFNSQELLARVKVHAELQQYKKALQRLASLDELTGLDNRRFFFKKAEMELMRVQRYKRSLSVMIYDLDNFKKINDTYGHPFGDKVLKKVAEITKETFREVDMFGRLGGEEFAVMVPETNLQGAITAAERFRQAIANMEVETDDGKKVPVSISIGLSMYPSNGCDLTTLIKGADVALYQAKKNGKNQLSTCAV
ncbi:MAG: diguanylate cyclase [Kiritimatiellae bacterium]|jgi:two-component system glycerol uptake and utilization response regulator|nr:diguanylate cyclase [Kiritimatiellia bacterium]